MENVLPPRTKGSNLIKLRSEEHTSELQSQSNLVCRLLLEKKKNNTHNHTPNNFNRNTRQQKTIAHPHTSAIYLYTPMQTREYTEAQIPLQSQSIAICIPNA